MALVFHSYLLKARFQEINQIYSNNLLTKFVKCLLSTKVSLSALPSGRSKAHILSKHLCPQPFASFLHMTLLLVHPAFPVSVFLYVSFLPFSPLLPLLVSLPPQNVSYPILLPISQCIYQLSLYSDSSEDLFISNLIRPSDLFHPSPHPHFKRFQLPNVFFS